jgi:hypothetical protein
MSRASPLTLELAGHFTTIRHAGETVEAGDATALTIGTLFAATLLATELRRDKPDDDDPRRQATYREFRGYATGRLLPSLETMLLASLSIEERAAPRPVAPIDLARCLLAAGRLIDQTQPSPRIGLELVERVEGLSRATRTGPESFGLADLPALIDRYRRIDEMAEVLELLGDSAGAQAVCQHARILARAALGRISVMMEACLIDRERRARLTASIVAADLLPIVHRVIGGVREEYDPATSHYGGDLGMAALRHFAAAALAIVHQALSAGLNALEPATMPIGEFAALLRLLEQFRAFGRTILESVGPMPAAGPERAAGQAREALRAPEFVQGIDTMTREMDLILAVRARDGSDRQRRLDAYAAAFEAFRSIF